MGVYIASDKHNTNIQPLSAIANNNNGRMSGQLWPTV